LFSRTTSSKYLWLLFHVYDGNYKKKKKGKGRGKEKKEKKREKKKERKRRKGQQKNVKTV
jgi:hypothetical protein